MSPRQPRTAKRSARTKSLTLLAVLAALVTAVLAGYALARDRPPAPIPPPTPAFSQKPANPSASPVATFAWASHPATDVNHYECREDEHAWFRCTSPLTYTVSGDGEHQFAVRALDAAGNASGEAGYRWKLSSGGNHLPFTISGNAGGQLYPGAPPRALALTLSNPNGVAIFVTALSVTVSTSPAGCPAASNLALTQSNASSATPVQVPAKGSVTLPAQGVSAPTVQLLDLPVNQDACRGAGFGLAYTGSAHS
jgi:hypothetical protein